MNHNNHFNNCHVVSRELAPFPSFPIAPPAHLPEPHPPPHTITIPSFFTLYLFPCAFFHVLFFPPQPFHQPDASHPIPATYLPSVLLSSYCRWVSHTTTPCLVGCLPAISRLSMRFDLVPQHRVWFDSTGEEEYILADCGLSSKCICPSRVAMLMRAMDSAF